VILVGSALSDHRTGLVASVCCGVVAIPYVSAVVFGGLALADCPSSRENAGYSWMIGADMAGNDEEIDCRHDAIKGLVLRTEFVRKR
jgi:hypothetical protein